VKYIHFWIHFYLNYHERKVIMIKPLKYPKAALTVSALLALTSVQGPAIGADRIQMDGEITAPTCSLIGTNEQGGSEAASNLSMNLGTGNLSKIPAAPQAVGDAFDTSVWGLKTITFKLAASSSNTNEACVFGGSATGWDILASPDSSDMLLQAPNGTTYLKNNIAAKDGGTDAVVIIKGGVGNTTVDKGLELVAAGTYLSSTSGNTFRAGSASSITMGAQLVAGTAGAKPVAGKFQSFINLLVKYN
jgi:hypothetical protein